MNSWISRLLLACAPPLMMFIIGTGMTGSRRTAQVLEQRLSGLARRGMRVGQRHRQQRIGAEPALGVGAVEFDHARIEARLIDAPPGRSALRAASC